MTTVNSLVPFRTTLVFSMAFCAVLCLSVLLFPPPAVALDTLQVVSSEPILEDRFWTTFDKSSGFAGQLRDLFEDREGNMWFATNTGVFQKYDGLRWTTHKVDDGLIGRLGTHIAQSKDGAMWFLGAGGVHRFDPSVQAEQDAWTHFDKALFHEIGFDSTRTRRGGNIWGAKDGAVWLGVRWELADSTVAGGIARYQNGRWEKIRGPATLPNPPVHSIYETRDGAIYFLVGNNGVLRYKNGIWTRITAADGLGGPEAVAMLEASDGALYFTLFEHGISRYHNGAWTTYEDFEFRTIGLWQTHDGVVWASGFNAQFYRLENDRWQSLSRSTRFAQVPWGCLPEMGRSGLRMGAVT